MSFSDASTGTFMVVSNGSADTVSCTGFRCDTDVVLTDLLVDGNPGDVRARYIDVVTGTFPSGSIVRVREPHNKFTSITLASGTITKII